LIYLLAFLEGIITFISPCILPMFPIFLSYFAGSTFSEKSIDINDSGIDKSILSRIFTKTVINAIGFTFGFTIVFVTLGAFAGTLGRFISQNNTAVNVVTGSIVIFFGLHFTGILNIPFLNKTRKMEFEYKNPGFISSLLFGIVFSIGWTPCVGVFLGSALLLAASQGGALTGILLLATYSLGLALPFILSAILINRLKSTFAFIKRHYKIITVVSGIFLIIVGIMMMFGLMGYFMNFLTI